MSITPVVSRSVAILAVALFGAPAWGEEGQPLHSHDAIRQQARDFLQRLPHPATADVAVQVDRPDTRLRLARCDQALEVHLPPSRKSAGRVTVGVRCTGSQPWSLYLPAQVQLFDEVLVASRDLPRGETVRAGDLRRERRDLTRLSRGYCLDTGQVIGKVAGRTIRRGQPLYPGLLDKPMTIRRGASVRIVADIGGVEAYMQGKALEHGSLGERIRIENVSSKRELEARIISAGTVRVDI